MLDLFHPTTQPYKFYKNTSCPIKKDWLRIFDVIAVCGYDVDQSLT